MFTELGMKIDNFIGDVRLWNTQRIWYKIYAYFTIKKWIVSDKFEDSGTFIKLMNTTKNNNQLWNWQYIKLIKIYEEKFE